MADLRVVTKSGDPVLRSEIPEELSTLVNRELAVLRQALDGRTATLCGYTDRCFGRMGVELEVMQVDRGGNLSSAEALLANTEMQALGYKSEFAPAMLELVTLPVSLDSFDRTVRTLGLKLEAMIAEALRQQSEKEISILCLGHYPAHCGIQALGEDCASKVNSRYLQLLRILSRRNGTQLISFTGLDGPRELEFYNSPIMAGFAGGMQVNLEVDPRVAGLAANWSIACLPFMTVIGSTSPFVNRDVGAYNNRLLVWEQCMDPLKRLTSVGPAGYYKCSDQKAWLEWFSYVARVGDYLLEYNPEAHVHDLLPCLSVIEGTTWNLASRLRIRPSGRDKRALVIELRAVDCAFTVGDNLVNALFQMGLMAGMAQRERQAEDYISYADVLKAHRYSMLTGDAKIVWRGRDRSLRWVIQDSLLEVAKEGLEGMGASEGLASQVAEAIEARLSGMTGSELLWRSLQSLERKRPGMSRHDAVGEVLRALVQRQLQEDSRFTGEITLGSASWELLC